MHILSNMRSKICIKFRLIIRSKFVTNKVVTRGEGVKANGDKVWQGRRGSKIGGRPVTYFLNGPLVTPTRKMEQNWCCEITWYHSKNTQPQYNINVTHLHYHQASAFSKCSLSQSVQATNIKHVGQDALYNNWEYILHLHTDTYIIYMLYANR